MKFAFRLLLLILFCGSVLVCTSQPSASQSAKQPGTKESELELMIRVTENKYCSSGGMLLTLEFEYKNVGKHNLILFKHALPPYQYRVSQNSKATGSKPYKQVVSPMLGGGPSPLEAGDEPPREYFVVLEPGQVFTPTNTIIVPVFIAGIGEQVSEDSLGPGDHVLELKTSTWPFEKRVESQIGTRWHRFGTLWTRDILSVPTTFRIAEYTERVLSNCNPR